MESGASTGGLEFPHDRIAISWQITENAIALLYIWSEGIWFYASFSEHESFMFYVKKAYL